MKDCIFCKIVSGEIPTDKVMETDDVIAFKDIKPSAEIHILIVPKKHIDNFETIETSDSEIISKMTQISQSIIKDKNPEKYRLIINGRKYLEVHHLHWHLQMGNLTKQTIESLLNANK